MSWCNRCKYCDTLCTHEYCEDCYKLGKDKIL